MSRPKPPTDRTTDWHDRDAALARARRGVDLVRCRDRVARRTDRQARASARLREGGDPGPPDAEGAFGVAAPANDLGGGVPA